MITVRNPASRATLPLCLLLACSSASAAPGLASAQVSVVWLWLVCALGALHLLRVNFKHGDTVSEMERQLAHERTARAKAELALADTHALVCKLVREQGCLRDAERSRIARDIHDDLGQNLLALRIDLSLMQVATNGIHPAIHQKIGVMDANLEHAIRSLRAVIHNLRPLALGEGLRGAIERQLCEFSRVTGIAHEFVGTDEAFAAGDDDTAALLYRVLQEALSNVARHARASRVEVAFACAGGRLTLRVADNGIGMQADPTSTGCGLAGMRERVAAAAGELAIDSRPGCGTVLSLAVPLTKAAVAG